MIDLACELGCLPHDMQERARFLLERPELGEELIGRTSLGEDIHSNCWGTTIYLLGDEQIERARRLAETDNNLSHPVFFWVNGRPGYVEENIMDKFIQDFCVPVSRNQIPAPGLIYSMRGIVRGGLFHTGVTLNNWRTIEQPGLRKKFQVSEISARDDRNSILSYYSLAN